MRLVRVKTPEGLGAEVVQLAFGVGIPQVSMHQQRSLKPDGRGETQDDIDIETATPDSEGFC
jgi:hypothetical protein